MRHLLSNATLLDKPLLLLVDEAPEQKVGLVYQRDSHIGEFLIIQLLEQ